MNNTESDLRTAALDLCEYVARINPVFPLGDGFHAQLMSVVDDCLAAIDSSIKREASRHE